MRQAAPNGRVRALATNLDAERFDAALFGDLYHQRWRIEEAFKRLSGSTTQRLKHRLHLEAVSGLSQQALIIDVAAKALADNITSLICAAAAQQADLSARSRKCRRAYAASLMQRLLPRRVLLIGEVGAAITNASHMLATSSQRFVQGRSQPRPARHVKPHPSCA